MDPLGPFGGVHPSLDDGRQPAARCCRDLGISVSSNRVELALWLCLAGAASAALSLNLYAIAQMFSGPRAAGTWIGAQNAIGNLSGIFGPIVTGIIVDRAGYLSAFHLTAVIAALGALWWAFGVPKIRQVDWAGNQG